MGASGDGRLTPRLSTDEAGVRSTDTTALSSTLHCRGSGEESEAPLEVSTVYVSKKDGAKEMDW